jgi:hypothetical protein
MSRQLCGESEICPIYSDRANACSFLLTICVGQLYSYCTLLFPRFVPRVQVSTIITTTPCLEVYKGNYNIKKEVHL